MPQLCAIPNTAAARASSPAAGPSRATRNATARATERGPKAATRMAASSPMPIPSARSCWISSRRRNALPPVTA